MIHGIYPEICFHGLSDGIEDVFSGRACLTVYIVKIFSHGMFDGI